MKPYSFHGRSFACFAVLIKIWCEAHSACHNVLPYTASPGRACPSRRARCSVLARPSGKRLQDSHPGADTNPFLLANKEAIHNVGLIVVDLQYVAILYC